MHLAPTPPEDFEPWETDAIQQAVVHFISSRSVPPSVTADDLLQEAFLHWAMNRLRYRPERGASRGTFLRRVIERRLISIQRAWQAEKRGGGEKPLYLDAPVSDQSSSLDVLSTHQEHDPELRFDLEQALAKLSERQRQVAQGIGQGLEIPEIAKWIGVSRDTVNEDRLRIREVFSDAGLRDYLR